MFLNQAKANAKWHEILESQGITDNYKKNWLSMYAEGHQIFENSDLLNESTYATLGGVNAMGGISPAAAPNGPSTFYGGSTGSGDKFPSLLPISIEVARRTVGFDVVSVVPLPGPTGVLTYLDYVYGGGKISSTEKPIYIKIAADDINSNPYTNGTIYWGVSAAATGSSPAFADGSKAVKLQFISYDDYDASPIFKVIETQSKDSGTWSADTTVTIAQVFDGASVIVTNNSGVPQSSNVTATTVTVTTKASLVNNLINHISGAAGLGTTNTATESGNYISGTNSYLPMSRETGESTYYNMMNLQTFTKIIQAETFQIGGIALTEQIQDLKKQWGLDVMQMIENNLINQISQDINKHILSRIFALGWSNNSRIYTTDGFTVNRSLDPSQTTAGTTPAFNNKLETTETLPFNKFVSYGNFENQATIQRRVKSAILAAANLVAQKGRRGKANFIVCGLQMATALQDNANYSFAPLENDISQDNGSLYPLGTVAGMKIYVDPNMSWSDNRVLVGRKGADEEPGVKFMPYIMAEKIETISEGTASPKLFVKSRYALVEAGQFPEIQYYTIYFDTAAEGIV